MPNPSSIDPLLPARSTGRDPGPPAPGARRPASTDDDRLARLAARTAARRQELGRPAGSPGPRAARPGLPPPPPGARPVSMTRPYVPASRPSRRHAAKGARTAALVLSAGATIGLAGWFKVNDASSNVQLAAGNPARVFSSGTASATTPTLPATSAPASEAPSAATAATAATASTPAMASPSTPVTAASSSSGLVDGTYTGQADQNRWGSVQVAITVSDGSISDVQVLRYPDGAGKSVRINSRALPVLIQETLTAQSADVNTVSGATYTSNSYEASLQSAIDAAMAAG